MKLFTIPYGEIYSTGFKNRKLKLSRIEVFNKNELINKIENALNEYSKDDEFKPKNIKEFAEAIFKGQLKRKNIVPAYTSDAELIYKEKKNPMKGFNMNQKTLISVAVAAVAAWAFYKYYYLPKKAVAQITSTLDNSVLQEQVNAIPGGGSTQMTEVMYA